MRRLGVLPRDIKGEVPQASQIMSGNDKIPKSRAKFYQREQRLKKLFEAQLDQWQREMQGGTIQSSPDLHNQSTHTGAQHLITDTTDFEVDVRLYKERGEFTEIRSGLSESQGCMLIYQLLDQALGLNGLEHEA